MTTGSLAKQLGRRDRELRAAEMRVAGKTEKEIAVALGMSQPGVHVMLKRIEAAMVADAKSLIRQLKGRQHARLEWAHREAVEAYERSRRDSVRNVTEAVPAAESGEAKARATKVRRETEGRDGDPAWLQVILATHDRIAKLWGLDAPVKVAVEREVDPFEELAYPDLLKAVEAEIAEERRKLVESSIDVQAYEQKEA